MAIMALLIGEIMKALFLDLFLGIRKSPFLFLFLFLQIVVSSVIIYSALANYSWIEMESNKAQISWGDKEYVRIDAKDSVFFDQKLLHKIVDLTWSSGLGIRKDEPEKYNEMVDYFNQLDSLYNDLTGIEGLKVIISYPWDIFLEKEKDWSKEDRFYNQYGMFDINNREGEYSRLHAVYIGKDYLDHFNLVLSEGEYFKENDYYYEGDYIPVLMGSKYKQYYSLGEEFYAGLIGDKNYKKMKVVGFIAENQYYTTANDTYYVYSYDTAILIPSILRSADDLLNAFSDYRYLFGMRITGSFCVIDEKKYDTVKKQIEDLIVLHDLDDLFYVRKLRIQKELASNYKDQLVISIAVCIATLLFSLFSFIFTMLYKIDGNMKNYAIRMVVGETYGGIAFRYLFESFAVFLLGQITGFFAFKIYAVNSYIYQGYDYLEAPTLRTGVLLNIAFYIITAIILYICINVKLKTYSLATLIRGNEVKKERRVPFYRVVIFLMLAIVGIFSMFIASYQVAVDRIDIYYTGYYTKNVKIAYVSTLAQEDAPKVKVDFDEIGAKAENAIINRYITSKYKGDDYITERGLYFNGYIDPVNMLEGRFFTKEEAAGKEKIAVVGKEIYNKYVTIADDGTAYYHSEDLEADLKVIGVMGKEDQATNLDFIVFVPIKTATAKFGSQANYTLDGKDKETVENLEKVFAEHVSKTAMVSTRKYNPRITVEAPTDMLIMLLIIIIINAIVFCFYYVSKQGHIHAVKKIVGYSKLMILADTFTDFLLLTVGAFVTGNVIVILLKETIFKNVQLFSIYMLDPQVIIISLVAVVALTVLLSVIAIARTFTSGNTNEYRV